MKVHATALLALVSFVPNLLAGEILFMKDGPIRPQDRSQELLLRSFGEVSSHQRYFVIQFNQHLGLTIEAELSALGLKVLRYLPDDAYLVAGDARAAAFVKTSLPGVRAVLSYRPEWKISSELGSFAPEHIQREQILVSVLDSDVAPGVISALKSTAGVEVMNANNRDITIQADTASIYAIAQIDGIEWIQRLPYIVTFDFDPGSTANRGKTPDYVYTGFESGTRLMGFEAAWSRGYFGEGQRVAVADTGLDTGNIATIHADFAGNLYKGFAIGLGSTSWEDSMGHGTHVSGSVVGNGTLSELHLVGGAHKAQLVMLGLWSSILDNLAPGTDFKKLIGTAYNEGARVHSNSWGAAANFGEYDSMASRVDEYLWNHPDMLVLFAAGNSGQDADQDGRVDRSSISSPGTAKNVLTVGASENEVFVGGIQRKLKELREGDRKWGVEPLASDTLSSNGNGIACFSSRGPTSDGRIKPEIVAPGTNVISTRSHHPKASPLWGEFDANYVYAGGTSMATPLTAGAATVAREYLIKDKNITNPSGALLKATLIHTARDLYPGQYGSGPHQELPEHRPNIHEGYGRVDMDRLTSLANETTLIDEETGIATGEEKSISIQIKQGESIRATLVYTDAPAAMSAGKSLVNDLDLRIVNPSGEITTLNDHTNNAEMLELSNLTAGEYKVIVSGYNIPKGNAGKQPFAVAVSPLPVSH